MSDEISQGEYPPPALFAPSVFDDDKGERLWTFADFVNSIVRDKRNSNLNTGAISDGFHTFDELYQHRSMLWVCLLNVLEKTDAVWKSRLHHDGTMFEGYFIAGYGGAPKLQACYHLKEEYWDKLHVPELPYAREWDGHTPEDVLERLERWFC